MQKKDVSKDYFLCKYGAATRHQYNLLIQAVGTQPLNDALSLWLKAMLLANVVQTVLNYVLVIASC